MSQEQDKVFFRNFSIVVGLLAVLMAIFIIAARIVGIDEEAAAINREAIVSELTAPMGQAAVAGETEEAMPAEEAAGEEMAASNDAPGKALYDQVCFGCHGSGIPGIPQLGDKAAWEPRIAQGMDVLLDHAINGYTGSSGMMMPPRGGSQEGDDAVKAAVDYIVSNSQ